MKLIIAGSRHFKVTAVDLFHLMSIIELRLNKSENHEIISGGCPSGPDSEAKCMSEMLSVSYKEFPADWEAHGKAAGPMRNKQMAEYGDVLLLVWDGQSKGSFSMLREMIKLGKPVYEIILKGP